MIKAEIVGHSLSPQGDELISVLATFPRIILAEVNTHRMLSKNTSSSRAIPFNKMLEAIQTNPFIPIAWQREHSGMQGTEYVEMTEGILQQWEIAKENAIFQAKELNDCHITKQICNRLLEPFMWTTMLITGSREGWNNFFKLRCPSYTFHTDESEDDFIFKSRKDAINYFPKDEVVEYETGNVLLKDLTDLQWLKVNTGQAEIHMMALAESIWDSVNESTTKQLQPGEWHIPFEDKFDNHTLLNETNDSNKLTNLKVKVSVAMAARTSYTIVGEEKGLNYENLIGLHNRLLTQDPPHSSPMEHCARAMNEDEYYNNIKGLRKDSNAKHFSERPETLGWCYNLKGFIPYRYFVDNGLVI